MRENNEFKIKCPVCGEKVYFFDICDNCNWQNSGAKENIDGPIGPNKITLREAIRRYTNGEKIH